MKVVLSMASEMGSVLPGVDLVLMRSSVLSKIEQVLLKPVPLPRF